MKKIKGLKMNEKIYNAGQLIKDIVSLAGQEDIIEDIDTDKILFSLGLPDSRTTLKIKW